MLGQWVLQNRALDDAGTDPMMLDLLRWHGAEEVEHRSLVYDVYQHVSGNYFIRAFSMLMTTPLFIGWWVAGARYLMNADPTIDQKWRWRDWVRAARQDRLPGPWTLLRDRAGALPAARPPSQPRSLDPDGNRIPRVLAGGAKAARERAGARQRPQGAEMTSGQQIADTERVAAQ